MKHTKALAMEAGRSAQKTTAETEEVRGDAAASSISEDASESIFILTPS